MGGTWRIGQVAERTGLTRRTLRHYDELGLLTPPARSWGNYRLYDEHDLLRLLQIQNLKALGLSLAEIGTALADPELDASATLRSHLEHLELRIAAEQRLAVRLRDLAGTTERSWEDVGEAIALSRSLAHPDPGVRLRAVFGAPAGNTGELLDALASETDPAVQEVLIWALAQQPDAGPAALARLDDPDPDLRCQLVRLLGKLRRPDAAPALIALLADPEPRVVSGAVRALAQLGDPSVLPSLVALLEVDSAPAADLIEAIAGFGEDAVDPVSGALPSPRAATRAAAAETLGRIGGSVTAAGGRASALLAPLLHDPQLPVRQAALFALSELGDPARPVVESALADPTLAPAARRLLDLHVT